LRTLGVVIGARQAARERRWSANSTAAKTMAPIIGLAERRPEHRSR